MAPPTNFEKNCWSIFFGGYDAVEVCVFPWNLAVFWIKMIHLHWKFPHLQGIMFCLLRTCYLEGPSRIRSFQVFVYIPLTWPSRLNGLNFWGIPYLVGKISRSNFFFQAPLAKWVPKIPPSTHLENERLEAQNHYHLQRKIIWSKPPLLCSMLVFQGVWQQQWDWIKST